MSLPQAVVWFKDEQGVVKALTVKAVTINNAVNTCSVEVDLNSEQLERQREAVIYAWCRMHGVKFLSGDSPGNAIRDHIVEQNARLAQLDTEITRLRSGWGVRLQNFLKTFGRLIASSIWKNRP